MNDLCVGVIQFLPGELQHHGISIEADQPSGLPDPFRNLQTVASGSNRSVHDRQPLTKHHGNMNRLRSHLPE